MLLNLIQASALTSAPAPIMAPVMAPIANPVQEQLPQSPPTPQDQYPPQPSPIHPVHTHTRPPTATLLYLQYLSVNQLLLYTGTSSSS